VRFHHSSLVTRPLDAFAAVFRSSRLKPWSRCYSLTSAWPARVEFPVSAHEGYASFLRPGLWRLVVVRGGQALLGSWDLGRALYAPTQETIGSLPARAVVGFFCVELYILVFSQGFLAMG
jgi:hypothetical protein